MILKLRLKLLGLLIGKLSVVANASIYGKAIVGDGLIINSAFYPEERADLLRGACDKYCDRLWMIKETKGEIDYCMFEGEKGLKD